MKLSMYFICGLILVASAQIYSQDEYDCVMRKDIYITKAGQENKTSISSSAIKNIESVELLFGKGYNTKKVVDDMGSDSITVARFNDGLTLWISDKWDYLSYFQITSDNYTLKLPGDVIIKVGMKAEELKAIFPKSYSNRKTVIYEGKDKGKPFLQVVFCFTIDNKTVYEDAWILFYLSKEGGILERFYAYELN